jgi:hypothetical protein
VCQWSGMCGCASAADCATAVDGPVCVPGGSSDYGSACVCKKTADCPAGKTCDPNALYCK